MQAKDLTGKTFGKLTVLRMGEPYIPPCGKPFRRWLCRCECGKEVVVNQNALTATVNPTTSCGCSRLMVEMTHKVGERRGMLEIIGFGNVNAKNGQRTGYLVRCDCGTEKLMTTKNFLSATSCGCETVRKSAERIKPENENVLGYIPEQRTMTCKTRVGMPPTSASKTGIRGVTIKKGKFVARIMYKRKGICLGRFGTIEEAAKARHEAEVALWGNIK